MAIIGFPPRRESLVVSASDITEGVLKPAQLGNGVADETTYLRGDGVWSSVSGGGGLTHAQIMSRAYLS